MVTPQELIALADTMAAAASHMTAITYDTLIQTREQFIREVTELFEDLERSNKD